MLSHKIFLRHYANNIFFINFIQVRRNFLKKIIWSTISIYLDISHLDCANLYNTSTLIVSPEHPNIAYLFDFYDKLFRSSEDVTFDGGGLLWFVCTQHIWPSSKKGFLSWSIRYNTESLYLFLFLRFEEQTKCSFTTR